jgi:transposase
MRQEKPKTYTAEFRESAVKLANESDKPIAQIARDLGINENTLRTWISKYSRPLENTKAVRTDDHLYEELTRLKKEVAQLSEERHLLKNRLPGNPPPYAKKQFAVTLVLRADTGRLLFGG